MEQYERIPITLATMSEVLALTHGTGSSREIGVSLNRMYFLFLDAVKASLSAPRWQSRRSVVHAAIVACVGKVLEEEDVCIQLNDEQYLLIFSADSLEDMAECCKRIADTLETRLYGEDVLGKVVIQNSVQVFSERIVNSRRADVDQPEQATNLLRCDDLLDVRGGLGSVFSEIARAARRTNLLEILGDNEDEPLVYGYQPVWHAHEDQIATYLCQPRRGNGSGAAHGYAVLGPEPDAAALCELDIHALEECLFALKEIHDNGSRVTLMSAVHFETLASRAARAKINEFLASVPHRFGRMLTLKLCNFPSGIPEMRLAEITANLGSWVGRLAVAIPISECPTMTELARRASQFSRDNIAVIAVDFERDLPPRALGHSQRLAKSLTARDVALAAIDVPTADAARTLAAVGYAYLCGEHVGPALTRPDLPRPFTVRDLAGA